MGVVFGNQFAMPPQNRIWDKQTTKLADFLATKFFGRFCKPNALWIGQSSGSVTMAGDLIPGAAGA
jgi:hypothetical protein